MRLPHGCVATSDIYVTPGVDYDSRQLINLPPPQRIKEKTMWLFSHLIRMIRIWRRYDAGLRELNQLGDRELADIGLSRSDIQRVAWENACS
jgi:uncharacterized protein YjiS (DUF1127 family)